MKINDATIDIDIFKEETVKY